MRRSIRIIIIVLIGGVSLAVCLGLLTINESRATLKTSIQAGVLEAGPNRQPQPALFAGLSSQESAFLDKMAEDTWRYLSSDWATANHLPWSWRSIAQPDQGDYASPAEIGLYALSWSPSWPQTESEIEAGQEQLRAWQTGSQSEQPNGANAYANSVFYQWYRISPTPPDVGPSDADHLVPSIDNAWLAASLITIHEYAETHNHLNLANNILSDMDFTHWYDPDPHRFAWGDTEQPKSITQATYYSDEIGDYPIFLSHVYKRSVTPLVVAYFNTCTNRNNLGGLMGAAYSPPDYLKEDYLQEPGRGCVVRLTYNIKNWAAFWLKLEGSNLTSYNKLSFDVKSAHTGVPRAMRIELKRAGNTEISTINVTGLSTEWQTKSVNLADFEGTDFAPPLSSLTDMEELVFVFEFVSSGSQGVVYLDNVIFVE